MRVTLLGTGEAMGVPPVFTDLDTCGAAARRRRSGLLVETDETTVVFDVSPDISEQVRKTDVRGLAAAFLTHAHHDHAGGVPELDPIAETLGIELFGTATTLEHIRQRVPYLDVSARTVEQGQRVSVGDLTVIPFPVDHARAAHDTVGFAIHQGDAKVVYAPDIGRFRPGLDGGEHYRDADLLFVEGSGFYQDDCPPHEVSFETMVDRANADRTVLLHVSEYLSGLSTAEMQTKAERARYTLGVDFQQFKL